MSNDQQYWQKKLAKYSEEKWSQIPSLFAKEAISLFPPSGDLLELGSGLGQDGRWFAKRGYNVTFSDLTEQSINNFKIVDMNSPLPFAHASYDIVYAHLSLHYFSEARTKQLFDEIHEILRPGGVFAFLVNSTEDPESNEGQEVEPNFRQLDGIKKRYFDIPFTKKMTEKFETLLLDSNGSSHKDKVKGLTHLVRFVGRK